MIGPWRATLGDEPIMNVMIHLSAEEEQQITERASLAGEDVAGYIRRLIERHIKAPRDLAGILAPLREQFAASEMSEQELDSLVEETRNEVWREKNPPSPNKS